MRSICVMMMMAVIGGSLVGVGVDEGNHVMSFIGLGIAILGIACGAIR